MLFPLLAALAIPGGLVGYAVYERQAAKKCAKGQMTPERFAIYTTALKSEKDPEKLRSLAGTFAQEGCTKAADMLAKRATLRALPKPLKLQRREVYRRALGSTNPAGMAKVADAFARVGALGAATKLRRRASDVAAGQKSPIAQSATASLGRSVAAMAGDDDIVEVFS